MSVCGLASKVGKGGRVMNSNLSPNFQINISLSTYNDNIGDNEVSLVCQALALLNDTTIKHLAWSYQEGDYETAASFLRDLESIAEVHRRIVEATTALAFDNYKQTNPTLSSPEERKRSAIVDFKKRYQVKDK